MAQNKTNKEELNMLHIWVNCHGHGNFYCHDETYKSMKEPMKFTCKWCGETFEAVPQELCDDMIFFFENDKKKIHCHSCEKLRSFELMREYNRVISEFAFKIKDEYGGTTSNNTQFMPLFSSDELAISHGNGPKIKYKCLKCGEEFKASWSSSPDKYHKCKEQI